MRIVLIALLVALSSCSGPDKPGTGTANNENNQNNAADGGLNNVAADTGANNVDPADTGMFEDVGDDLGVPGDMSMVDASLDMTVDMSPDMPVDMGPALRPRGDCTSDADCNGTSCLTVPDVRGGYNVCETTFADPTSCQQNPDIFPQDECCKHTECTDGPGQCVSNMLFFCGGALPPPQNVCRYDACDTDADCTETSARRPVATCVPRGAFGEPAALCSYGTCQVDADCTERAGGECTAFFAPCANRFTGFFCTYDDSTCRTDADCPPPSMQFATPKCVPGGMDDETQCIDWLPPI